MNKHKKTHRFLALLLAGVMCMSMLPTAAFAETAPAVPAGEVAQTEVAAEPTATPSAAPAPEAEPEAAPDDPDPLPAEAPAEESSSAEPPFTLEQVVEMNKDLPHAPTGGYMGTLGLPVATGETRISIGPWQMELLTEEGGRLDAAQLAEDNLTVTAPRQEGQSYAVVPLSTQVEYPANGSSAEIFLPEGVELLNFASTADHLVAASDAEKQDILHADFVNQAAASQGFYVKAEHSFTAKLVYTDPAGSQLEKQVHVTVVDGEAEPLPAAQDLPTTLAVDGPPPPFTTGRITKCVKGNGTWIIWFNGEEAYCCTHGQKGRATGCPLYSYAYTSLLGPDQKKATHEETQISIWGALEQTSLGLLTEQHAGEMPAMFAMEGADVDLAAYCYHYYDDAQLYLMQNFPNSMVAKYYVASAQAAMEQEFQPAPLASATGYYTWIFTPPIEGWQTLALIGPEVPAPDYYADWFVGPQSAEGAFDSTYEVNVNKEHLRLNDKVDGAVIEIEPLQKSGTIAGGQWALDPADKQTVTTSGHTMDEDFDSNGGAATASWKLHYRVSKTTAGGKSGRVGPYNTQQEADAAAAQAKKAAEAELRTDAQAQVAAAIAQAKEELHVLQFRFEEITVPTGFEPWDGEYASKQVIEVHPDVHETYTMYNEEWKNKIAIQKVDSETGSPIKNDATFTVFAWDKVAGKYMPYGGYNDYHVVRKDDLTYAVVRDCAAPRDADPSERVCDTVYYTQRNEGKFLIVETKAPDGYYGDWTDVTQPGTAGSVAGKRAYAVQITKENNNTQILLDNDAYNADIAAGNEGGTLLHTKEGDYTIHFHTAKQPAGKHYVTDAAQRAANEDGYTMQPVKSYFQNDRIIGSIALTKHDLDAMRPVQPGEHGTGSIEGAVYDLYAAEDICHPDGFSGVVDYSKITDAAGQPIWHTTILENGSWNDSYLPVLKKNHLVASASIQDGKLLFTNLYLGKYYLVERATGIVLPLDNQGKYHIPAQYPNVDRQLKPTGETTTLPKNGKGEYTEYVYKNRFSTVAEGRALDGSKTYDGYYLSFARGYLCDEQNHYQKLRGKGEAQYLVQSEAISEDALLKSGFALNKLISSNGDNNGAKLENAGFTVFRVEDLSKAPQFRKNPDGQYDLESILDAYRVAGSQDKQTYDFSQETQAAARMLEKDAELVQAYNHTLTEAGDHANGKGAGWVATDVVNEYRLSEIFTNAEGILRVEGLPYGQYLVVETTVPQQVFQAQPFLMVVDETFPLSRFGQPAGAARTPSNAYKTFNVLDDELEGYLCVEKIDAETGKAVRLANTAFQLFCIHADGTETPVQMMDPFSGDPSQKTSIFKTDSEGRMKTPEKLPLGKYRIVEVEGPDGFSNDSEFNVVFTLSADSVWESAGEDYVIRQRYANHETLGRITIHKTGEVLSGKQQPLFRQNEPAKLLYEVRPLAGAEFTITAAEDIYTQDRQLDENGNRTLWYAKGDVVAVVTTGDGSCYQGVFAPTRTVPNYPFGQVLHTSEEGTVSVILPLGSYQIQETKAPHGYVLDPKLYPVTLTWENQEQSILPDTSVAVQNEREKAKVGIYKKDAKTGKFVAGAVFNLYTKDDIYSADGEKLFSAGERVATSPATNAEGYTYFEADIPLRGEAYGQLGHTDKQNSGSYTIVEAKAPEGYLLNPTPMEVTFTYSGQVVQTLDSTCENYPTEMQISKRELTGDAELPGAALRLTDSRGKTVREWVSGNEAEKIKGLHLDEIYTLTETIPAPGYALAESIRFKLAQAVDSEGNPIPGTDVYVQTGRNLGVFPHWEKVTDGTVVMRDDITRVEISKQDITNQQELPGAHLVLKTKQGEIVDEWTSTDKPHYLEKLPAGEYVLSEITAPSGYAIAEDVSFTVQPTGELQTVVMKDRPILPSPKTGDTINTGLLCLLAVGSLVGAVGTFVYQRRRKQ